MIVNEEKAAVVEGLGVAKSFTIKASSKAFEILSSSLYKDPMKAIIRELACNAYDSHVAAGKKEEPFVIKLPNELDNTFYVEDFGLGLSEEDVLHLYTTYFESTKTNSNDYVGALGLGSKTPFSYTKEFTVVSRFNGVESHYLAYLQQGAPQITKLSSVETDECNGVKVQVEIQPKHHRDFVDRARTVLRPFEFKPVVRGVAEFEPYTYGTVDIQTKGYTLYSASQRSSYNLYIRMGNIDYPVHWDTLGVDGYGRDVRSMLYKFFSNSNKCIVVDVPIGSISFSASREEIHYTDDVITFLFDTLKTVKDGILKEHQDEANKISSFAEYVKYTNKASTYFKFLDIKSVLEKICKGNDNFQIEDAYNTIYLCATFKELTFCDTQRQTYNGGIRYDTEYRSYHGNINSNIFYRNNKTHFVIQDISSLRGQRLEMIKNEYNLNLSGYHQDDQMIVIKSRSWEEKDTKTGKVTKHSLEKDEFVKKAKAAVAQLGFKHVHVISEFKPTKTTVAKPRANDLVNIWELNTRYLLSNMQYSYSSSQNVWRQKDFNRVDFKDFENEQTIYVLLSNRHIVDKDKNPIENNIINNQFNTLRNIITKEDFLKLKIVGASYHQRDNIPSNWVTLEDAIKKELQKKLAHADETQLEKWICDYFKEKVMLFNIFQLGIHTSRQFSLLSSITKLKSFKTYRDNYPNGFLDIVIESILKNGKFKYRKMVVSIMKYNDDEFVERYPLLKNFNRIYEPDQKNAIVDYIKMCDTYKKLDSNLPI